MTKAAQRGEPSYVWRDGQKRRFEMLLNAAGERLKGRVLVDGSGVGTYFSRLIPLSGQVIGLDIELPVLRTVKNILRLSSMAPVNICLCPLRALISSGVMRC